MAENRLLLLRTFFFIGMLLCFSLQSYRSFKKFLDGKSSLSESDIPKKYEPLPTFSICSEPPFDGDYMRSDLKISPNFFLFTSYMNTKDNGFAFPTNLSERSSLRHVFSYTNLRIFLTLLFYFLKYILKTEEMPFLTNIELSNFSCMFLNPNNFFQFEL